MNNSFDNVQCEELDSTAYFGAIELQEKPAWHEVERKIRFGNVGDGEAMQLIMEYINAWNPNWSSERKAEELTALEKICGLPILL